MFGQTSQGDLSASLYSWAHNLLPLVTISNNKRCCIVVSLSHWISIMLHPKAQTILVDGALREGEPLIPLPSFEILVRLTLYAPTERVKSAKRLEATYPLLKDVALSPERAGGNNAKKHLPSFALRSARKGVVIGNHVLAKIATSIATWCVSENIDCFKHWYILYRENLEASVVLLKEFVGEHKYYFLRLSTSLSDTLTVNQTMERFRPITEGGANWSLYKESD
ncbi:hypothetical protein N665_0466s0015 [Sinapis alba]|nr:hypothetical protein N665_0466s0015 [Sinapis alba]